MAQAGARAQYAGAGIAEASATPLVTVRGKYDGLAVALAQAFSVAIANPVEYNQGLFYPIVVILHEATRLEVLHLEAQIGISHLPTTLQVLHEAEGIRILHRATQVHIDGGDL